MVMMSPPMRSLSAVGISAASSLPRAMTARREQRSASSIRWVVSRMVTPCCLIWRRCGDIDSQNLYVSRRNRNQRREDAKKRGLAAAVGPEEAEDFAGLDGQRKVIERRAGSVCVREMRDFDDRSHRLISAKSRRKERED